MTTEQLLNTPRCGVCWRERASRAIVLIDEVHDGSVRFHAIYDPSDARTLDVTELGAGNIGGKTLVPGVYKWGTALLIPTPGSAPAARIEG